MLPSHSKLSLYRFSFPSRTSIVATTFFLPPKVKQTFVIWLDLWADKMNQILRCDWLPKRERWSYLARYGLLAVSRKKNFLKTHKINPLLTTLIRSRYWPRSFFASLWINSQRKKLTNIQPSWPNNWSITHTSCFRILHICLTHYNHLKIRYRLFAWKVSSKCKCHKLY